MMRYRLIKPEWGKPQIKKDGEWVDNPDFKAEISGPNVLEGYYSERFLREKNDAGYNIYFFPNHPSKKVDKDTKFISGKMIDQFNCVFLDMDLKDKVHKSKKEFLIKLKKFSVKPTKVVDSGHGIHAYWYLSDLSRDAYIVIQLLLSHVFQTDTTVYTTLQLMRAPGYTNNKRYDAPVEAKIIPSLSSKQTYEMEELIEALPEPHEELLKKATEHIDKLDGRVNSDLVDVVITDDLPEKFELALRRDPVMRELFSNPVAYYGDRSAADFAIGNFLFSADFSASEAVEALSHTLKARSRSGQHRFNYAANIVDKIYGEHENEGIKSAAERLKDNKPGEAGERVPGPAYLDCLENGWRKSEVLGLIGGTGVGKTQKTLSIIKEFLINNPKEIAIFFSLEMPAREIVARAATLFGKHNTALLSRFFVEDNESLEHQINYQDIISKIEVTRKLRGKEVCVVAIDHLQALGKEVDTRKKLHFGLRGSSDRELGYGPIKTLTDKLLCKHMKTLAKHLNVFLIVQNQTTKSRGEQGDIPLGIDAAYGTAFFEWFCDYILTIWQPIMRVYDKTSLRVLAWRYCKIRNKGKTDGTQVFRNHALLYDEETGEFRKMTPQEFSEFDDWRQEARRIRKEERERKEVDYATSPERILPRAIRVLKKRSKLRKKKERRHA